MANTRLTVIVMGGGIGGLTTANALQRAGCDVHVYERQTEIREVGAGMAITPNSMVPLGTLGLRAAIERAGTIIEHTAILSYTGRQLSSFPMADVAQRLGSSSVTLHRPALLAALYEGFGTDHVHVGKQFVRYEQDAQSVTAHFADGSTASGDLLIAADGVHSAVREQLLGAQPTRYSGYVCYRGLTTAPFDHPALPRGHLLEIWGRGIRMGASHIAHGRLHWWFSENLAEGELPEQATWKQRLLSLTAAWAPPGPQILHATEADAILCNYIHDRMPDQRWTDGRVALLGDAAHPMEPNLGQGANQAIEDAVSLANSVVAEPSWREALQRYERLRKPRTAEIQRASRQFGVMGQWTSPLACNLRAAAMWLMPHWLWVRQFETLMRVEL
jgi:2-polyprenyl-6-methoxyphenol hydroxylase-like FAD-dependent oxidoreductase